MDVDVRGGDDFYRLSKAMKAAGRTDLRKDLNKGLRDAVKPLIPVTRAAARRLLPNAGGLAESVARAPQRVQVRTGAQTAGVRLVVGKRRGSGAAAADRGSIRHPVFGTDTWVTQQLPAAARGWFGETLEREAPDTAKPAVEKALNDMAERIVREAKRG